MRLLALTVALSVLTASPVRFAATRPTDGEHTTIRVDASRVLNHVSPWMIGSCIEDVNHEIYGGLGAQLIFGESFEEPPAGSPLTGWRKYGGQWFVSDEYLQVPAEAGAKMVQDAPVVSDGTVECYVRFADTAGDNAGLILRVADPRTGADTWTGYEVSLSIRNQSLILGRHRNDWNLLKTAPFSVKPNHWHHLKVELAGPTLRIYVDGEISPLLAYTDMDRPLLSGLVGVRTWQSNAGFRDLTVRAGGRTLRDSLTAISARGAAEVSGMWQTVQTGNARASFHMVTGQPVSGAYSQQISLDSGTGTAGVANSGLNRWGISVRRGEAMSCRLYASAGGEIPITVALQSADGSRTYVKQTLPLASPAWTKREFTLRPSETDPKARLAIWIDRPGTIWLDQVSLTGTGKALFRGGPYRADIGEALVRQGLTFLRYGGSMVNATEYRWKKMVGDPDKRPPYKGWWYPHSSNRFGIEEFVRFCELANFEPAVSINIDETPEDAADMVEYLNGPASSPWGRKRAQNGHPKPYNLRYIQIGNEEAINGDKAWYERYLARFKALEPAIHRKDPRVQLVIAAWWRPEEPWCKRIAQELKETAALWDVHVGGDDLREGANVDRTLTQMEALFREWIPGSGLQACIFEENGDRHDWQRALGHAHILNVTERHGDFVKMDCPANCLQPLGQNDNGWNQGQVFFTPSQVWGMPPYWAQQMAAMNHLPLRVESAIEGPAEGLDVTATRNEAGSTVVLKVVNVSARPCSADHHLEGGAWRNAEVWSMAGSDLRVVNTPERPEQIRWKRSGLKSTPAAYTFPAYSYTILRFEK